ncbi:bis(5'-nucleosyl)-tetraphosphatase (symmetrical) YqeK [Coriobacterium glomerans]|nr:bis(5'-nucleosyl)-tetraphosphatase (symmetrical) YqeK [Coriobacterium glomerans]
MSMEQEAVIRRIRELLAVRLASDRRREEHSLRVADTAEALARTYGADVFAATAAGLIHDWDRLLSYEELVARAARYGVPLSGPPLLVAPLLHGPVAAVELQELFPELPDEVFQAVARHTTAAPDMSALDMVVFIADGIEPGRRGEYADRLRAMVGQASLREVFFACLTEALAFVIKSGRYVYPLAIESYNRYATIFQKGDS